VIPNLSQLAERARISGDRLALFANHRSVSYRELAVRVNETEEGLAALGINSGQVVAVLLENGLAFAEILHAVAQRGVVLLPLNTRLAAREIAYQLSESGARYLIHGAGALARLAEESVALVEDRGVDRIEVVADGSPALAVSVASRAEISMGRSPVDPDNVLALVYTSGTTGSPKAAQLTHRNLFWSAIGSAMHLGATAEDRWLVCMPLFHVGGLSILLRSALYGSAAILHEHFDPIAVNRALDDEGITLVSWVPTMLHRVLEVREGRRAPRSLRCVLLGGGPAPRGLIARARAQGFAIAATYGLTEAASQVATQIPNLSEGDSASGLRPIFGTEIETVDDDGKWVRGRPGEILVRGPSVMEGYWNCPDETASVLKGGWLHTGDLGVLDVTGGLEVLERRCDLIISGGENIYPTEVETVLLEHPAIREAAVAGREDSEYGYRPIAWLVVEPGSIVEAGEVSRFCRDRLAGYKVPIAFTFVEALPRTSTGKLRRDHII
jgi:O-succinylbenzoic acid--CoA ligase